MATDDGGKDGRAGTDKADRARTKLEEKRRIAHEAMAHLPVMPKGHIVLEVQLSPNQSPWGDDAIVAAAEGWAALFRPSAKSSLHPVWAMAKEHKRALRGKVVEYLRRKRQEAAAEKKAKREREKAESDAQWAAYWAEPGNATRWTVCKPIASDYIGCNQAAMLLALDSLGGDATVTALVKAMWVDILSQYRSKLFASYAVKRLGMGLWRRGLVMPVGVSDEFPAPAGFALTEKGREAILVLLDADTDRR